MKVIGLTGGIAMGKSHAARIFTRAHIPVFDADATVHHLQSPGGAAIAPIAAAFPGVVTHGTVDRTRLRQAVLGHPGRLRTLEAIMHPLVRTAAARFIARHCRAGRSLLVLDVPLLLEAATTWPVDTIVVVSAPPAVQQARIRKRGTITPAQLAAILARQLPDAEKRRRADQVVRTGLSRHHAQRAVRQIIAQQCPNRAPS